MAGSAGSVAWAPAGEACCVLRIWVVMRHSISLGDSQCGLLYQRARNCYTNREEGYAGAGGLSRASSVASQDGDGTCRNPVLGDERELRYDGPAACSGVDGEVAQRLGAADQDLVLGDLPWPDAAVVLHVHGAGEHRRLARAAHALTAG